MIFLAPDWRQGATTWADEDCTMSAPSLEPCGTGAVHRIYQPHPAAKAPIISNHIESQDRTRTRPRDIWSMRSKHMPRLCYLMLYICKAYIYILYIYIRYHIRRNFLSASRLFLVPRIISPGYLPYLGCETPGTQRYETKTWRDNTVRTERMH